jgi:hypothetical protein
MEITLIPNKGKTYQLFDKDRQNGKDKYFKVDTVKSASVKVDGQNTAIMLNKDGKFDFMVRLEIKDSSHNKSTVLDKTIGKLETVDDRPCWVVNITLNNGRGIEHDTLYKWHCFHLDEEGLPFRNHIVGYIVLPDISTYKHIQDVVYRDSDKNITHINCALLDSTLTSDNKIHMTGHKMSITEFMTDKQFITCELMAGDSVCKQKYALPNETLPFVIIHGAIPVPDNMCPTELSYNGFDAWFKSGNADDEKYNCYAEQEGIVFRQDEKFFKVRHGSCVEKGKVIGDEKMWNSKKGCGLVFDVSNILKV